MLFCLALLVESHCTPVAAAEFSEYRSVGKIAWLAVTCMLMLMVTAVAGPSCPG